jgi:hypothetical protein
MLSFLKDNENKNSQPETVQDSSGQVEENDQTPQEEQDYLMPANTGKSVKRSTILLTVLIVIGAAVIWGMIKKTVPRDASAAANTEDLQVESAIAKLTGIRTQMYGKLDQIAEKFYQFSNVNQVSVDQLSKNPFVHANAYSGGALINEATGKDGKNAQWRLWSIMDSQQGLCCMINDKLLYVGDSINGMIVNQIGKNAVELTSDQQSVVLRISQ